jgi:hypothetical protein
MQRRLREYIAYNINSWVGRRHRSLWIVMAALKDTYALDMKRYTSQLEAARAQQTERREGRARDANRTITVRYEHPQPISNSEQGDVALHHTRDCSLSPTPTLSGAWHTADPSEPHMPEGSAKSASDASQGAERPCHSSIRKTGAALRASSYARASRATLLVQDRSGLSNDTDALTTAGGRKALPCALVQGLASAHGARAFCPPSNTEHAQAFDNNGAKLPTSDSQLKDQQRAECPRSAEDGLGEREVHIGTTVGAERSHGPLST